MSYPTKFDPKDPDVIAQILTVKLSDEDLTDIFSPSVSVGDSVRIVREGKHKGKIGVVVKAHFDTVVVEPYNDPYYNNPQNITKLGPFSQKEVEKVKRPKGASTEYTGEYVASIPEMEVEKESAADALGLDDGFKIQTKPTKRGDKKAKAEKAPRVKPSRKAQKSSQPKGDFLMKMNDKQKARMLEQVNKVIENHEGDNLSLKEFLYVSSTLFGKRFALDWIRRLAPENVVSRGVYSLAKTKAIVEATVAESKPAKQPKAVKAEKEAAQEEATA